MIPILSVYIIKINLLKSSFAYHFHHHHRQRITDKRLFYVIRKRNIPKKMFKISILCLHIPFLILLASVLSSASILIPRSQNDPSDADDNIDSVSIPDAKYSSFSSSVLHQDIDNHIHSNGHDKIIKSYLLPHNISIVLLKWHPAPSIRVSWSYDGSICEAFRIIYHPITSR